MKNHNVPKLFVVSFCLFLVSMLVNDLNHALSNPPMEWLFWATTVLIWVAVVGMVVTAVKAIRDKHKG